MRRRWLTDWIRNQLEAGWLRSGQIGEAELRDQSRRFLREFNNALKSGEVTVSRERNVWGIERWSRTRPCTHVPPERRKIPNSPARLKLGHPVSLRARHDGFAPSRSSAKQLHSAASGWRNFSNRASALRCTTKSFSSHAC
jgi:hypothetical protein